MPNRVCFVVDGFNLYWSLKDVAKRNPGASTRWLDLRSLCESYLHVIGGNAVNSGIFYFSAIAKHLEAVKPGLVQRHETYAEALRSTGVTVQFSRFKQKDVRCPKCKQQYQAHEEKETDVAIGVKVVELAMADACDTIVLLSGDTDLIPALRTARHVRPNVKLCVAFPFGRVSKQMTKAAHRTFKIHQTHYTTHQLPDRLTGPTGVEIAKPQKW